MASKSKKKTQKRQAKKQVKHTAKKTGTPIERKTHSIDNIPSTEYDMIFEKKLAEQYRLFRSLKEHHIQTKKFIRVLIAILVIILVAILLISFSP